MAERPDGGRWPTDPEGLWWLADIARREGRAEEAEELHEAARRARAARLARGGGVKWLGCR